MKGERSFLHDTEGMTTLEFALVLPLVLLLLFGTMDMLRYVWTRNTTVAAAVEAAETGALRTTTDEEIRLAAERILAPSGLRASSLVITRETAVVPPVITVRITVDFSYIVLPGFLTSMVGARVIDITKRSVMGPEESS
ncbi:MAG TPA: pilus assembly protein TadE [Desulfovibrio sp.]|nr:pilus assembly protein TadE [Desulfovibrio sp.]